MKEFEKIDLIYVASIGRSGSTLLESILGAHSQMETCGEVHLWPHEIMLGGVRPCGSGEYVDRCPFWSEMRRRVDPLRQPDPNIHFFREQHNAGRTLRWERLRELGTGALRPDVARQVEVYGRNNHALFSAFLDVVEERTGQRPRWVVDASKDPYRLLWLLRSGLFHIKVFHLVKDPRAFAYSVTKPLVQAAGGVNDLKRLYYTFRQSLAWSVQNYLFSKIAKNHLAPSDYLLIRYETLASKPKETFQTVCETIGCTYEEAAVDDFRKGSMFTIAGNPMRYESRGIALDERWKHALPPSSRKVAEAVASFSMAHYGYH